MNIRPEPESPRDVPEADALEQQMPVLPEATEEFGVMDALPDEAPEADVMEQRAEVLPGGADSARVAGFSEAEASEADLVEQALALPFNDEEDYPEGHEEAT